MFNTTFIIELRIRSVAELTYLRLQTESFHEHSKKQSKGSVNPYVNFSDLTWYEFALPPLDEQRRMARVPMA
jgi:type I restriction enzyme S subunit